MNARPDKVVVSTFQTPVGTSLSREETFGTRDKVLCLNVSLTGGISFRVVKNCPKSKIHVAYCV